jgi:hypothetical protein
MRNGMSLFGRLFAFVGIFGLVGPAVGGVVAWATMGARSMRSPAPFVTGAYPEGIFLALTVGILTGFATLWLGQPSWVVPVVASVLVSMAFVVAFVDDLGRPDLLEAVTRLTGVFLPPSLAAGLVCWWLGRWLLVPR